MLGTECVEDWLVAGAAGGGQVRATLEALAAAGGPEFGPGLGAVVAVAVPWNRRPRSGPSSLEGSLSPPPPVLPRRIDKASLRLGVGASPHIKDAALLGVLAVARAFLCKIECVMQCASFSANDAASGRHAMEREVASRSQCTIMIRHYFDFYFEAPAFSADKVSHWRSR
jgi:hypothetical protein